MVFGELISTKKPGERSHANNGARSPVADDVGLGSLAKFPALELQKQPFTGLATGQLQTDQGIFKIAAVE